MEPVTAMLAALQLAQSISGGANAAQTASDNLAFQKSQAANNQRMAEATRVDSNGNKQQYDPATNTWKSVLSPMQQAIQDASNSEQLQTLTTDAARKRAVAANQFQMSEDAGTPYNTAVQNYVHNQPKSEDAINNDLQTLMINANQASDKGNQATLTKEALRLGRGADIPQIIKSTNDTLGNSTASTMLNARQQALQEHTQRVQSHDQQYLPEIQTFKSIIDGGAGGPSARFSDLVPQTNATQSAMAQALQAAGTAGDAGINTAAGALTTAEGKVPDFSKLITAMAASKGKAGKTTNTTDATDYGTTPDYLNNISYGQQDNVF